MLLTCFTDCVSVLQHFVQLFVDTISTTSSLSGDLKNPHTIQENPQSFFQFCLQLGFMYICCRLL